MRLNKCALIFSVIAILSVSASPAAEASKAILIDISKRSQVPTVNLPEFSGRRITLNQYRGSVVLLDFWATWCGGCKQELPWFADFETAFKSRRFSVVAVSTDEGGWPTVNAYVSSHRMPGQVLLDDGSSIALFHIEAMPVALLLDRHGKVAARYVGLVDRENIRANIDKLLRER